MHRSTAARIAEVKRIVAEKYEPGRQDRNKGWVLRTAVAPLMGISRRTFSRYLSTPQQAVDEALGGGGRKPSPTLPVIPGL